jgi:hypothetical protein
MNDVLPDWKNGLQPPDFLWYNHFGVILCYQRCVRILLYFPFVLETSIVFILWHALYPWFKPVKEFWQLNKFYSIPINIHVLKQEWHQVKKTLPKFMKTSLRDGWIIWIGMNKPRLQTTKCIEQSVLASPQIAQLLWQQSLMLLV